MPKVTETLRDAQALAEFSNLESADVEYFRHNYADFVPDKWWGYRNGEQWQMTQRFLRESWENQFTGGFFFITRLVLSVFNPDELLDSLFGFETKPSEQKAFAELGDIPWGATPFQRAVLHLFERPWRARFCSVCKKRFVAVEPKNKFCSQPCSDESSRLRHNEWARKNLKTWRRKQKQRQMQKQRQK
jgi:hypothetical protein